MYFSLSSLSLSFSYELLKWIIWERREEKKKRREREKKIPPEDFASFSAFDPINDNNVTYIFMLYIFSWCFLQWGFYSSIFLCLPLRIVDSSYQIYIFISHIHKYWLYYWINKYTIFTAKLKLKIKKENFK